MQLGYLYRHVRTDTDEVFYVGIGFDKIFSRARTKRGRNVFWNRIVQKTPYHVEILLYDVPASLLYKKEKEFIQLYGRRDLNRGSLCNLTDGDVGAFGCKANLGKKRSDEFKRKLSIAHTGKKLSPEHREKIRQNNLNISDETRKKMSDAKKGVPFRLGKYKSKVVQTDLHGNIVKIWDGAFQAEMEGGFHRGQIGKCCQGKANSHKGFFWKYYGPLNF